MSNYEYNVYDYEAIRVLDDFLPSNLFDAHMHLSLSSFAPGVGDGRRPNSTYQEYLTDMAPYFKHRSVRANIITEPDMSYLNPTRNCRHDANVFLNDQLAMHPECVGEIIALPNDNIEVLEQFITSKQIIGFKCYHTLIDKPNTWDSSIGEYLPDAAWEVANDKHLCITLHMVKDRALSDKSNLEYIKTMACRYPNAMLILAHAARSFAAWTIFDSIDELVPYDNIYFDLSAICESPSIFQIIKKTGTERCMWGSDYSCCMLRGKAISLADGFYWIYDNDIRGFSGKTAIHSWLIGTENLMAVRQACIMLDLDNSAVEKIFYKNACGLFLQ